MTRLVRMAETETAAHAAESVVATNIEMTGTGAWMMSLGIKKIALLAGAGQGFGTVSV